MMDERLTQSLAALRLPPWEALPDFGLYMDQLVTYTARCGAQDPEAALTPTMINNYVKSGLIARPQGKKYARESLAQLLIISQLKQTTSLDTMKRLLHPADGRTTEALYGDYRTAQDRLIAAMEAHGAADALTFALEAAACQLLCRRRLEAGGEHDAP